MLRLDFSFQHPYRSTYLIKLYFWISHLISRSIQSLLTRPQLFEIEMNNMYVYSRDFLMILSLLK